MVKPRFRWYRREVKLCSLCHLIPHCHFAAQNHFISLPLMAHCRFHLPHQLTCFILVTSYLYSRHPTTDLQALRFSFYYCTISSLLSRPKAGSTPVASILPFFLSFSTSLTLYFVAIVNKGIRIGHEFPCLRLFTETVVDNPRHISNHCPSSWTYH